MTGGLGPARAVHPRRTRLPWAELLRRVFALDVLVCSRCGGPMTVIAYITEAAVVAKILTHLGLPTAPPPLFPAEAAPPTAQRQRWSLWRSRTHFDGLSVAHSRNASSLGHS